MSAARVLLAFCMVFTYPMECIVTRHCLLSIVGKIQEQRLDKIFSLVKNDEHSGSSCSDSSDSPRSPHAHTHNNTHNSHSNSQEFFGGINPMTKNIPQLQLQGSRNIHDDESDLQNSKRVFHGFLKNGKSKGKKHDTKNSDLNGNKVKENDLYVVNEGDDEDENEDENGEVSIYFGEEGDGGNECNGHSKTGRNGNNEEKRGRLNDIHCGNHTNNNSNGNSMETSSSMNSTANEKSEIEEKTNNKFSPYTVKERKTGTTESGSNFTEIFIQDGDDNMSEEGSVENKRRECSSGGKMIRTGREDDYNIDANTNNHTNDQNKIQCKKDLSNLDPQNNGNQNQNQNVKSNSKFNNFEISVTKIDETVKRKFPGSGFYYQILATRCSKSIKNNFFPDKNAASRVGVTLLLWGSSVVIALLFRDLGVVQALTGTLRYDI